MTDGRAGEHGASHGGPEWPMAPGVPGSANAREARTLVGLSPEATDAEFIGASPSEGRDALVAAARRRLEPVLAAHGLHSRESWIVDHELKSALGRLLARMPTAAPPQPQSQRPQPLQQQPPAPTAAPPQPPKRAAPTPPAAAPGRAAPRNGAEAATSRAAAPPVAASGRTDLTVARALYLRRSPIGRALLGAALQSQRDAAHAAAPIAGGFARGASAASDQVAAASPVPHAHASTRSRARMIAATIAVLSAIGLVIEIAYVPVHLQRSRTQQEREIPSASSGPSAPHGQSPEGARRAAPLPQPAAPADSALARPDASQAGGTPDAPDQVARNDRPAPAPKPAPIPSPALPADGAAGGQRPAPAESQPLDPTLRQRLDRLTEQWAARVRSSVDAARGVDEMAPGPMRWLAQAKLLERLIALDDIAQLLIEARADDAETLVDVMPVACSPGAPPADVPAETSSREDGRLVTDLSRAGGGGESRLAVLRAYRSLPLAPGRADARALVSEALGGPSRNSRALALAILLERGGSSVAVLEAVHARVGELTATPAGRAVVEQLAGEVPGGAPLDAQSLRARLARRILAGRGAPLHLIDSTADAAAAMLDRMARRADPQVAPADVESSLATLARTASRDAPPARLDGASGPLQRLVASLSALEGARVVRNYRRLPDERARIDMASAAASARVLRADSSLAQAIAVAVGLLAQDSIALRAPDVQVAGGQAGPPGGGGAASANPLLRPAPSTESLARWPQAAKALAAADGAADADMLIRIAEDVQDSSTDDSARSVAARLYARAALAGTEATAASAARGIASLIPARDPATASERHRWESIAAQYAMADAAMRGIGRAPRRAAAGVDAEADASSRTALADALALCLSGYGRQASDRLQSPTVRALAQRISSALPGGMAGLEAMCEGRNPGSPPLEPQVADQLLAIEAALREPRSMRWSDDLALRRGLPLVSVDAASRAARASLFTPAPAPGPQ